MNSYFLAATLFFYLRSSKSRRSRRITVYEFLFFLVNFLAADTNA